MPHVTKKYRAPPSTLSGVLTGEEGGDGMKEVSFLHSENLRDMYGCIKGVDKVTGVAILYLLLG
ncbi:hypothetical protein L484_014806 [Morus notabilis]|uniref:Uncharacterized protein n=1 Tax=Morus notabilis TaxID=981085 RepID=W9QR72_9ROSA|nr:hypothetical protein L484_010440 [Morus notabilis]EXC33025.1 hypothetical protein L484_014806 [Morus notabilis]